jgi:predicted nucleic acid-binding protein
MFQLLIDTNVLLRFYAYSDDSLTEVEKLSALQKSGEINIIVTDQIVEEHYRNRDRELAESIKRLEAIASVPQIPRFAEHYAEAKELREAFGKAKEAKNKLIATLRAELAENNLRADKVIEDLLASANVLRRKNDDVSLARLRRELGNPPGKKETLGDQINWEILLRGCPNGQDLHLVSRDGDFHSNVVDGLPNNFLRREWREKKQADIFLYKGLGEFAKLHFQNIKLPSDALKSSLIKRLETSGAFSTTHEVIAELQPMIADLVVADAIRIFQALLENQQIRWIFSDDDVLNFYKDLYSKFIFLLPDDLERQLIDFDSEIFDVPF